MKKKWSFSHRSRSGRPITTYRQPLAGTHWSLFRAHSIGGFTFPPRIKHGRHWDLSVFCNQLSQYPPPYHLHLSTTYGRGFILSLLTLKSSFCLIRSGIEPISIISVADTLSTRPLIPISRRISWKHFLMLLSPSYHGYDVFRQL